MWWFSVALRPQRRVGLSIRDGDRVGRGRESERLDRGNRPKKTGATVDRRQNSVKAVSPRHCPATCALPAQLLFQLLCWTVTKTMSVAPLLTNNLDNSKQTEATSNLLSPAPPPYSWSLLGKCEVQLHLPPLRSLDLLISPGTDPVVDWLIDDHCFYIALFSALKQTHCARMWCSVYMRD